MTDFFSLPVKVHDKHRWGCLALLGKDHEICGETCHVVNENYSFAGGHRVRIYRIKKNVYWKIPGPLVADIKNVAPPTIPSGAPRRTHHK